MIRKHNNWTQSIDKSALIDNTSLIIGNIEIKKNVSIWPHALIRATDNHKITVNEGAIILDKAFIEAPITTVIGKKSIISHGAIIHGGKIGNNALVGIGAIILGVSIGDKCIIGAGSVVTKNIPDNMLVKGIPGIEIRKISNEDLEKTKKMWKSIQKKAASVIFK